jgi:hypothetical protein
MRLGVIEVVLQLEVLIQELERDLWMQTSQGACLNSEVLFLSSGTMQLFVEGAFDRLVPGCIAKPFSTHLSAA